MKVLFIYPDVGTTLPPDYQHGVGTLIALLKGAGHEASLIYLHREEDERDLVDKARAFAPDLAAVSSVTNQYPRARAAARRLKEELPVPIVIGGVHATLSPEEVMAEPCFDVLCRGEGEGAMLELVEALSAGRDFSGIMNLWVRQGDEVVQNPLRPLLEDLDSLPFVDREAFAFEKILEAQSGKCSMLSGRGCPYSCTYCANEGLRGLYKGRGRFVRMRGVDHVIAEMKQIMGRYDVKVFDFNDDILTLKRSWLAEFCERVPREVGLPFHASVRVETVDREALALLKAGGCELIRIGLESGSDRVRREVLGRAMKDESIVRAFEDAEAVGLKTWSFNMVGAPGETEQDARQTLELNRRLCPDHMQVSVFNPYPGTKLFDLARERGVISRAMRDGYFLAETSLNLPEFPPDRIRAVYEDLIQLRDQCSATKRLKRILAGRPVGYDFVESLGEAEIETPESLFVGEDFFWIGADCRRVLRAHPPARVRYRVTVPPRSELRLCLAMHPEVLERGAGKGVVFTVRIGRFKQWPKVIHRQTLDPKNRVEDRGWKDVTIDLGRWSGKQVWIEFETEVVDPAHPEHNTVGFGYPIIVERL